MRLLLVAIMIVLLPVRGWVGDVMATRMAAPVALQQATGASTTGTHVHAATDAAHDHSAQPVAALPATSDCADHAGAGSLSENSACKSCVVCQVCNTVALELSTAYFSGHLLALWVPPSAAPRFASADRALGLKPPIS